MTNNINKLCYQLVFIVLSAIGALLSTHIFTDKFFSRDFYIYYTNLTNFLCLAIISIDFSRTLKLTKLGKESTYSKTFSVIKSAASILIFITFLIFNILLADYSLNNYFFNLYNLLFHIVLPIMFITYNLLTNKTICWLTPMYAIAFQVIYVAFIFIRAAILNGNTSRIIFPYFFLNYQTLGVNGIIKWLVIMLFATLAVGYGLILMQKFIFSKNKK